MTEPTTFTVINIGTLSANKFWGETERVHAVSATCTLLQVAGKRVLVDPSPYAPELGQMLYDRTGLRPDDIDQVFVTHFHGDHRFGLDLFPGSPWLMSGAGLAEWLERNPADADLIGRFMAAEGRLADGLDLLPSPGHTMGHCSLGVETDWGTLIVAGDAVMTPEYFRAEEGYRNAVDFSLSTETIRMIKGRAQLVLPGHGNVILNYLWSG